MPKITKEAASDQVEAEGFAGRYEDLAGYTVGFETYTADADMAPFFVGLPDDRCQCPHWGQVFEGSITVRYADGREETSRAGDVYYWPAGHTGWTEEGVTFLEFSPTTDIMPVLDHLAKQLATG
jgi:hypothetical protein